jgi:hypothetical protein
MKTQKKGCTMTYMTFYGDPIYDMDMEENKEEELGLLEFCGSIPSSPQWNKKDLDQQDQQDYTHQLNPFIDPLKQLINEEDAHAKDGGLEFELALSKQQQAYDDMVDVFLSLLSHSFILTNVA